MADQNAGKDNQNCGSCKALVKSKDKAILCGICTCWFHIACQDVTMQLYKVLSSEEGKHVSWFCQICKKGSETLFTHIAKISREQETIKTDVDSLKGQNDKILEELRGLKDHFELNSNNEKANNIQFEDINNKISDLEFKMNEFITCRTPSNELVTDEVPTDQVLREPSADKLSSSERVANRVAWNRDKDEQYGRRENIRVFGVPETEGENPVQIIVDLAQRIDVPISLQDISTCHRVGRTRPSSEGTKAPQPRVIIAKFVRRDVKMQIMKNKKFLGNKKMKDLKEGEYNIYINEDLTPLRNRMKHILMKQEGVSDLWTNQGKINFTYKMNGKVEKVQIDTPEDLIMKMGWTFGRLDLLRLTADTSPLTPRWEDAQGTQ